MPSYKYITKEDYNLYKKTVDRANSRYRALDGYPQNARTTFTESYKKGDIKPIKRKSVPLTKEQFFNKFYPIAEEVGEKTGYNPKHIFSQWAYESGHGQYIKGEWNVGGYHASSNEIAKGMYVDGRDYIDTTSIKRPGNRSWVGEPKKIDGGKYRHWYKTSYVNPNTREDAIDYYISRLGEGGRFSIDDKRIKTATDYAHHLKEKGYYEADADQYAKSLESIQKMYFGEEPQRANIK